MTSFDIHIPHPVFAVETDYQFTNGPDRQPGDLGFKTEISVGGVVVYTAEHTDDYELREKDRDRYAYDVDDARDKTLAEFGKKLAAVLA